MLRDEPNAIVLADVLPAGARVVSTALNGTLLVLTVDVGGETRILALDLATNQIVRRISLGAASQAN